ncbi:MAG TPA: DUF3306 domain-containing protein [Roseobacter sp.]|uniref:DUF3306 domain-containing protein n=1 Tax=marine sediment metagenome TaxID=412755 RepID=A0A0F9RUU0_9ZZZZ|nr:DUF3306 domain-containing protein [Roseobacter sp.]
MTRRASFWERRRAGVKAEEASVQQAAEEQALADQQVLIAEKSDEELLAEFDLPDPDTLKAGDDFTAFMAKAIPDHLRRRALRKLWVSDPVLACLDDLVDYADDYTQVSAVTDFTTSYQVGKGLREHIKDVAVKSAKASAPDAPLVGTPEEVAAMVQPTQTSVASPVEETEPAPGPDAEIETDALDAVPDDVQLPPRRMAFHFEDQNS